jgi:hypothetical protein
MEKKESIGMGKVSAAAAQKMLDRNGRKFCEPRGWALKWDGCGLGCNVPKRGPSPLTDKQDR